MSEKMTRIRLRGGKGGSRYGQLEWGEHSFEAMVCEIKNRAKADLEAAQAILAARTEDFDVDIVRGPYVQHHVRKVERLK